MQTDFNDFIEEMRTHGMPLPKSKTIMAVQNSNEILKNAMTYFLGIENKSLTWRPEYDQVAKWLENTGGKGLFMYGDCGLGKSLLGRYAIPAILLKYCRKVVNVFDMNQVNEDIDSVLTKHIISIDDVGTEDISVRFGNRRMAFAEIMDEVEKESKVIIVSTNLQYDQLIEKYGVRVMDRIVATTERVKFTGKSLRI